MSEIERLEMPIVAAGVGEIGALLEVMARANRYASLKSGKPMWTTLHAEDGLRSQLEAGGCFVMHNPDQTIAAAISIDEEDTELWGTEGNDGKALYFHKLMKNPEHAQANSGITLMHFTAQEALRRGKQFIRCDTILEMPGLIAYYKKFGFSK
jgi:hypothetical protein